MSKQININITVPEIVSPELKERAAGIYGGMKHKAHKAKGKGGSKFGSLKEKTNAAVKAFNQEVPK